MASTPWMPLAAASTVSLPAVERLPQEERDVAVVPVAEELLPSAPMRPARQPIWPPALMPPQLLFWQPARRRQALKPPPVLGLQPARW